MVLKVEKMLILDTSILIELERKNEKLIYFLREYILKYPTKPYITAPTYSEFYYTYVGKKAIEQKNARLFLEAYEILHTTRKSSELLAQIKHFLDREGRSIPIFDAVIASIVLDNNATLLTSDSHFKRVPNLSVIIFSV